MIRMTDKQFYTLFGEALNTPDRDAFSADRAHSSIFREADTDSLDLSILRGKVWDLAHLSVAEIRARWGLTQAEFAVRYCIPFRTVQNWEYRGGCPAYVRLMLVRLSGMAEGVP